MDTTRLIPWLVTMKLQNAEVKKTILGFQTGKNKDHLERIKNQYIIQFLNGHKETQKTSEQVYQTSKENLFHTEILYLTSKLPIKCG